MNKPETSTYAELVECEICLKEIPSSEAKMEEASDYVWFFCGLDCYAKWREQDDNRQED